jgi:hypothetical protein
MSRTWKRLLGSSAGTHEYICNVDCWIDSHLLQTLPLSQGAYFPSLDSTCSLRTEHSGRHAYSLLWHCSFQKFWTSHCLHDKNQFFAESLVSFNGITSKFFFYCKEASFVVWSRNSALVLACIWPSSICQLIQKLCFVHVPLCIHLNHQWLLWKMKLGFFVSHQLC